MNKNKIVIILFVLVGGIGFASQARAAQCGPGSTPEKLICECGDTVMGNYTLPDNLTSCTGHGLVVGANSITIDGNGYTITGDGGSSAYGINNSGGYDNITIKNLNVTSFARGIYFSGVTGSTIENVTANSNSNSIWLSSSSSNTLTNNTANSNSSGIYLDSSSSNTLTNNTVNSNRSGIYLSTSSSNTLTGNITSGNKYNLWVSGTTTAQYDNTIGTTNKVEGKSVYYFYNKVGTTENPFIYDGNVLGNDIGMFWCISCDYVQVKNATLSANNYAGVYFRNTTNSTIENVIANSNYYYGIWLSSSSSNTLTNNTANSNSQYGIWLFSSSSNDLNNNTANSNAKYGIWLSSSSSNTLTNNTTNSNNEFGIYFHSSSSNTLTSNIISNNSNDLYDNGSNAYSSNQFNFNYNMVSRMLTFTEVIRTKNLNDTVSFVLSMFDANGSSCSDCSYAITTSPSETVTSSKSTNNVTGSFTVTRPGAYSLKFTITDSNSNITKRNYLFLVGNTNSQITPYYLRGINPTHSQPAGSDAKSLLLTTPTSTEAWSCAVWVQNSPDEIPNYPLAILSRIDTYTWYKQTADSGAYIGIQRYVTFDQSVNSSSPVGSVSDYTWVNKNFTDLNWAMDYPQSWYWLSLKLNGTNPYWATFPSPEYQNQPSYADFTYSYTTTPAIKSISDENIIILSATADASNTGIISIVLEDSSTADTSTMDIVLSSPVRIDISIDTWNTTAPYYKQWTEEVSEHGIMATHTISGFAPNNYYAVKKDGLLVGLYLSNNLGEITFTCLAGSVFTVESLNTVFQTGDDGESENHCFIATATYGTPMASEVRILNRFRDECLLTNPVGIIFVKTYYKISPPVADFIRAHPVLKKAVRGTLNPLIWLAKFNQSHLGGGITSNLDEREDRRIEDNRKKERGIDFLALPPSLFICICMGCRI